MRDPNPMARIAASLGPSRWHPWQRREWRRISRRLMAASDGAHWLHHSNLERAWLAEYAALTAEVVAAELSGQLPDGLSVAFDVRPISRTAEFGNLTIRKDGPDA